VCNHRGDLSRRGAYRRALKASASPCGGMGSPLSLKRSARSLSSGFNRVRSGMTRTMRAWRKANTCIRSGQHRKAIYWLFQTQEILEGGLPPRKEDWASTYVLIAIVGLLIIWMVKG